MGREKLIYIPLLIGSGEDRAEKIVKSGLRMDMVAEECRGGFTS